MQRLLLQNDPFREILSWQFWLLVDETASRPGPAYSCVTLSNWDTIGKGNSLLHRVKNTQSMLKLDFISWCWRVKAGTAVGCYLRFFALCNKYTIICIFDNLPISFLFPLWLKMSLILYVTLWNHNGAHSAVDWYQRGVFFQSLLPVVRWMWEISDLISQRLGYIASLIFLAINKVLSYPISHYLSYRILSYSYIPYFILSEIQRETALWPVYTNLGQSAISWPNHCQ